MKSWLHRLARWTLGGIYIAAGGLKAVDPKGFGRAIVDYQIVPELVVPALAVLLPWWELIAGGLAVAGLWRRGALAVLTGLSAVFLVVVAVTLGRGLTPACACFGVLSERIGPTTLSLELLLVIVGVLLLRHELRRAPTQR